MSEPAVSSVPPAEFSPPTFTPVGYVKLWYAGVQVSLPLPCEPVNYGQMLANLDAAIAAGFAASLAGLEQGENKDVLGWVVRTLHDSRSGTVSALDLYLPDDKFSKVRLYLNNEPDVKAFEALSGLLVDKLPIYEGSNKIERFVNRMTDAKVTQVPRPMLFVWKNNPAYNPDEKDAKKKKPARLFVRWDAATGKPAAANGQPPAGNGQPQPGDEERLAADAACLKRWKDFTMSDPPVEVFNAFCEREYPEVPQHLQQRVTSGIRAHAKAAGWAWDEASRSYTRPESDPEIPF